MPEGWPRSIPGTLFWYVQRLLSEAHSKFYLVYGFSHSLLDDRKHQLERPATGTLNDWQAGIYSFNGNACIAEGHPNAKLVTSWFKRYELDLSKRSGLDSLPRCLEARCEMDGGKICFLRTMQSDTYSAPLLGPCFEKWMSFWFTHPCTTSETLCPPPKRIRPERYRDKLGGMLGLVHGCVTRYGGCEWTATVSTKTIGAKERA